MSTSPILRSIRTCAAALLLVLPVMVLAQSSLGGAGGQAMASPAGAASSGLTAEAIVLELSGSTGDATADERLRQDAWDALGLRVGDAIDETTIWLALRRLRALSEVQDAHCAPQSGPLGVSLQCRVIASPTASPQEAPEWPRLHESTGSLVKLIVNGGVGLYTDGNAFFGNWHAFNRGSPIAPGPDTGKRVSFADFFIEPGLGFITRVAPELYAYGAATVLASGTWGQDIYQRNDRMHVAVEKAYAGLLWAPEKGRSVNASFGRQNYTLNDGFLIHHVKGSTNVGERRAVFLGARTAHDRSVVLNARVDRLSLKFFHLDPNEYEPLESGSRFAGGQIRYDIGGGLTVDGTYIENRRSRSSFATPQGITVPRAGIKTTAAHLRWRNAFGLDGLFLEGEFGQQRSGEADLSARAGYATAGWRFDTTHGKSAVVLRLAQWSGDKPETSRYERWDPLLPAGSDEWMGGMIFSKYVANSNLRQWRLRYFSEVSPRFNFTVDWFKYRAMETNNMGANRLLSTLSSKDLGDELMFTGRWSISRNHYLQTLASINWPGAGIRHPLPSSASRWTTLQVSLYWFY